MQTQYVHGTNQEYVHATKQQPSLMGDIIENLPYDQTIPSHNEIRIVDTLFKREKSVFDRIMSHTKNIWIMGVLFVCFSLPPVDILINKWIPITTSSPYILICIKALMFMFSYFLIKNIYLARKT